MGELIQSIAGRSYRNVSSSSNNDSNLKTLLFQRLTISLLFLLIVVWFILPISLYHESLNVSDLNYKDPNTDGLSTSNNVLMSSWNPFIWRWPGSYGKKKRNILRFLNKVNDTISKISSETMEASWNYETNITIENQEKSNLANSKMSKVLSELINELKEIQGENNKNIKFNEDIKRKLAFFKNLSMGPKSELDEKILNEIQSELIKIYSTAKFDGKSLDPELNDIMANSRDFEELKNAYLGWRSVTGPKMKNLYSVFVDLQNKGAIDNDYANAAAMWKSQYEMPPKEFAKMIENIWDQLSPLYEQLHCYVHSKLTTYYGEEKMPKDGFIPAHLLGNMWSQDWSKIFDLVIPFPDEALIDVTSALNEQGYDALSMHKLSEQFYVSLGYATLPKEFWKKSILVKPDDREVVCHPSAWDFGNNDLRIKMCGKINQQDLFTIHHEQGHLYYDHYYKNLHYLYRDAAADFFHEAIGDTMVLSIVTPTHLKKIIITQHK